MVHSPGMNMMILLVAQLVRDMGDANVLICIRVDLEHGIKISCHNEMQ